MYACGPTVHDRFTIGNARAFVVFDGIRRYLEFKDYEVIYTQNITDIEDKVINRSKELGAEAREVAERYTRAFFEDVKKLGIKPPTYQPKATEMLPQIVEFIQALMEKGYAYASNGNVYYRVRRFGDYGKLSGKRLEELKSGARVEVDQQKEDSLDFALWKAVKPGEPSWESPWGAGRPGWHIECSVMATSTLGETIDIHGGGADLIFPHHENEIAQSEAKTGKTFARFWLHNGLLMVGEQEMHKSSGNFEYAADVVQRHGREAVRLFFLSKHYRKPMAFSHEGLEEAQAAVERVYNLLGEIEFELERHAGPPLGETSLSDRGQVFFNYLKGIRAEFEGEMDDDFNTAGGIGVIFELVRQTNIFKGEAGVGDRTLLEQAAELIRELGEPLGLFQEEAHARAKATIAGTARITAGLQEELINLLVEVRSELRAKGEFALADRVRARLNELGIELRDREKETFWSIKR